VVQKGRKRKVMSNEHTNQMDDVGVLGARYPDKEIVRLDIAVDEGLVVDRLDSGDLMCG